MTISRDQLSTAKKTRKVIHRQPFHVETSNNAVFAMGLCYIALPCIIFLTSFVRPSIGWPLAAALLWLLYKLTARRHWTWSLSGYFSAAMIAGALALLVGIPRGHSAYDWVKHWALINEIANHAWPVRINLHGEPTYLRFYVAAYLVPAFVHKAIPLIPVVIPTTIWFFLGYLLVFRVAGVPYERRSRFIAAAGMIVPMTIVGADGYLRHFADGTMGRMPGWIGFHYGNWGTSLEFASGLSSLAFVPHQSIPVFITAAIIVLDRGENSLARAVTAYGLLALWSPFGMIGLLPVMVLRVIKQWRQLAGLWILSAILLGITFALLVCSYLSTDPPQSTLVSTGVFRHPQEVYTIAIFLAMELLAYFLLLGRKLFEDPYCVTALGTVVLIPLFHGQGVDFVARGVIGPLFILALRGTEHLFDFNATRARWIFVALAAAICIPTTLSELAFHYEKGAEYRTPDGRRLAEAAWLSIFSTSPNVSAREFFDICGWQFESQYFSHSRPKVLKPEN